MNGSLVSRIELTPSQRGQMLGLMQAHFEGITAEQFSRDLAEKNWVIVLEDAAGRLRGFSTLLLYPTEFNGKRIRVIYSGDTIVDHQMWGSSALGRTWIGAVNRWRADDVAPLYWLLISSGFRTYRFLPLFWREFFPRYDVATLPQAQELLDFLATERFGEHYDPRTGIVHLDCPQVLREDLRRIESGRLRDPHLAFFARRNPGHVHGDELVCLTELSPLNMTMATVRLMRAAKRLEEHAQGVAG
jgi:hypothetical protein